MVNVFLKANVLWRDTRNKDSFQLNIFDKIAQCTVLSLFRFYLPSAFGGDVNRMMYLWLNRERESFQIDKNKTGDFINGNHWGK